MKQTLITELIAKCKSIFEVGHYSRQCIGRYTALWKKGILKYMSQQGLTLYSPEVGKALLSSHITGHPADNKEQVLVRSTSVLGDCLLLGRIRMHPHEHVVHVLHGTIGQHMQPLIDHLKSIRRSETTIKDYQLSSGDFPDSLPKTVYRLPRR